METINGEWYMKGCAADDPRRLRTVEAAAELIRGHAVLTVAPNLIGMTEGRAERMLQANGLILGEASTYASYPGTDPEIVKDALAAAKANSRIAKHYNVGSISAEEDVGNSLNEKRNAFLTKAIVASVEDFDKEFDEGMEDYMISGGQDIIDERIEKLAEVYGITFEK